MSQLFNVMNNSILSHGALSPLPVSTELRAGSLTVVYESGFIRYIRNGKHEVIRMINHYLRDHNWTTIPMRIHDERIERGAGSFKIFYRAVIHHEDIRFSWQCAISGDADETISFKIDGEAESDFMRNRLGFTILLPAGILRHQTCRITHPDGTTDELFFPDKISPHQPFLDIQSMAWSPSTGVQAALTFAGDVFEMEDQRNWMDASHKVYCTPLELGFPKKVKRGDRISQSVHLKVFGDLHHDADPENGLSFSIEETLGRRLPAVGIPLSGVGVTPRQLELIGALTPDFISVEIKARDEIDARIAKALQFGRPLEIMLFPDSSSPENMVLALKPHATHIKRIVILVRGKKSADATLVNTFTPLLRKHIPKATIGSGTDAFFTELNRNPTPADALDFLSFSVNPQTHASDLRTMTENLEAHRDVVESCRALSGGRDVRVGPVTLKMRWNPDATEDVRSLPGSLPPNVDARQLSLFAGSWALGSLKYLTEANAATVTFFEMAGWRGLLSHPDEPWPSDFDVQPEQAYPVYIMLRWLLSMRDAAVVSLTSNNPLILDGMAFRDDQSTTVFLANYSADAISVELPPILVGAEALVVDSSIISGWISDPLRKPQLDGRASTQIPIPGFGWAVLRTHA